MKPLIGTPVFRVGDARYYWEDVLLAGVLHGEWALLERQVREELGSARRHESTGAPLPSTEIETAAAEFRYARGLVSASEMHAWLDAWGMSAGEWMSFIRRAYLREHAADTVGPNIATFAASPEEIATAMPASFICSGLGARLAKHLAEQVAATERVDLVEDFDTGQTVDALLARFPGDIDISPFGVLEDERLRERRRVVARLEHGYARFRDQVLTPNALDRELQTRHLDWIRVDYRSVAFSRKSLAREAVFCVREDRLDVGVVAEQAGAVLRSASQCLADVSGEIRDRLLAARAGELVGPLRENGGFVIHQIDAKRLPSLDDPDVRERVEASVVERRLAAAVNDLVQWHVAL